MTSTARVGLFRLGGIISIFNYPWLGYSGFGCRGTLHTNYPYYAVIKRQ